MFSHRDALQEEVMFSTAVHHAGYQCHACSVDITGKFRNEGYMMIAFTLYENVVEYIESLPEGAIFSRVSVWRALGAGYKEYGLTTRAIRDMYAHGVIECVKPSNGRCLGYRVRRDLDVRSEAG